MRLILSIEENIQKEFETWCNVILTDKEDIMINSYLKYKEFEAYYGESFHESRNFDLVEVFNRQCPYCGAGLSQKHYFQRYDKHFSSGECIEQIETIYYCQNDGWWQHKIYERQDVSPKNWYSTIHEGILKTYDDTSSIVPIQVLNDYIFINPDKITNIHDKKMEELVASVFGDFYNCEAKVVGKSSDGGIDVILIDSDSPTMIQVKRRRSLLHTESVSGIRDLLGATLLNQTNKCIFVSTADKFSKEAEKTASLAIKLGLVKKFDLVDYDRFVSMLKSRPQNIQQIWDKLLVLNNLNDKHYGLSYVD
jgi:hypothetical protein